MKPLHVAFVWHMHQPIYEREPAGSLSSPASGTRPFRPALSFRQKVGLD